MFKSKKIAKALGAQAVESAQNAFEHIRQLAEKGVGNDHATAEQMLAEIHLYAGRQSEAAEKAERREARAVAVDDWRRVSDER